MPSLGLGFNRPHEEAIAILKAKTPVSADVFYKMLPELRARAFTVSGIEDMSVLQAIRDEVATVPAGEKTWTQAKKSIADALEPYLGDGANIRAEMVLRANAYQAFAASNHRSGMASPYLTHCQYVHGHAEVPTPEHLALDGIILPKRDPFWNDHTGPWGHLGCVCSKIFLFIDTVAAEMTKDEKKEPDEKLVLRGPAKQKLNEGDLVRNGKKFNVSTTEDTFHWHPDNLRIPIKELEARYDPSVFQEFKQFAQQTILESGGASAASPHLSLWDWLSGKKLPSEKAAEVESSRRVAESAETEKNNPPPPPA